MLNSGKQSECLSAAGKENRILHCRLLSLRTRTYIGTRQLTHVSIYGRFPQVNLVMRLSEILFKMNAYSMLIVHA